MKSFFLLLGLFLIILSHPTFADFYPEKYITKTEEKYFSILKQNDHIYLNPNGWLLTTPVNYLNLSKVTEFFKNITSYAVDSEYNIWHTTYKNEIYFTDKNNNRKDLILDYGINFQFPIYKMVSDLQNNVWICAANGIYSGNSKDFKFTIEFNKVNSPIKDSIRFLLVDKLNRKWFISLQKVYRFDGNILRVLDSLYYPLSNKGLYSAKTDSKSQLWLCSKEGLWKYDNNNWESFNTTNSGLVCDTVTDVDWDTSGNMWVCSKGNLMRFSENEGWKTIIPFDSTRVPYRILYKIQIDKNNNIWATYWLKYEIEWISPREVTLIKIEDLITNVKESKLDYSLFPNPVTSSFSLSGIPDGAVSYEIIDIFGENILPVGEIHELPLQIDVSRLLPGVYFLRLNNQAMPLKFIKI
jgi:ligand-binding sensor domain-containing protein